MNSVINQLVSKYQVDNIDSTDTWEKVESLMLRVENNVIQEMVECQWSLDRIQMRNSR